MAVILPFRKPNATAPAPRPTKPKTIAERVNAPPETVAELDLSQVVRIEGRGEDGSPFITYGLELELQMRRLVARLGMPRVPFTAAELDALIVYAVSLEAVRGDGLPDPASWQRIGLALTEKQHPGYAPGMRYYIAQNLEALKEHHRTVCGYAELVAYNRKYNPEG